MLGDLRLLSRTNSFPLQSFSSSEHTRSLYVAASTKMQPLRNTSVIVRGLKASNSHKRALRIITRSRPKSHATGGRGLSTRTTHTIQKYYHPSRHVPPTPRWYFCSIVFKNATSTYDRHMLHGNIEFGAGPLPSCPCPPIVLYNRGRRLLSRKMYSRMKLHSRLDTFR